MAGTLAQRAVTCSGITVSSVFTALQEQLGLKLKNAPRAGGRWWSSTASRHRSWTRKTDVYTSLWPRVTSGFTNSSPMNPAVPVIHVVVTFGSLTSVEGEPAGQHRRTLTQDPYDNRT